MKWRCNPKNKTADNEMYFSRGIRVSEDWLNNYPAFRDWALANGYTDKLSIDRFPDQNGNYEPSNCRWTDGSTQCRNTRRNHFVTAFGETKLVVEWVEDPRCHIRYGALLRRLNFGWNAEDAISKPKMRQNMLR